MSTPKGMLLLIGGSEDRGSEGTPAIADQYNQFYKLEILKRFVELANGHHSHIEIIAAASTIPEEMGEMYRNVFAEMGQKNVNLLEVTTRQEANNEKMLQRIRRADAILFSGGDQFRLNTIIGGTELSQAIRQRYIEEEIVVAGTSAGAMAMANTMLYEGHTTEAMLRGDVKTSAGLGFVEGAIIDTHFIKRGRFSRLAQAVVTNPACVGIGLGEDTALLVRNGNEMECLGSGMVVIIDGKDICYTNIAEIDDGAAISIENLRVHVLVRGNGFQLTERRFLAESSVVPERAEEEATS